MDRGSSAPRMALRKWISRSRLDSAPSRALKLASNLAAGFCEVSMPESSVRKYPRAPFELKWWYVFPSVDRSVDPITAQRTLQVTVLP
jgi:hypothetical protein